MLREDVDRYTKLTGEDGWHVPIIKVGAYLDGYNKGLEVLDKIRAEIVDLGQRTMNDNRASGIWTCRDIIDKYRGESEE